MCDTLPIRLPQPFDCYNHATATTIQLPQPFDCHNHATATTYSPSPQLRAHRVTQEACQCYAALVLLGAPVPLIQQAASVLATMQAPYSTPAPVLSDTQLAMMVAAVHQWPTPELQLYDVVSCVAADVCSVGASRRVRLFALT